MPVARILRIVGLRRSLSQEAGWGLVERCGLAAADSTSFRASPECLTIQEMNSSKAQQTSPVRGLVWQEDSDRGNRPALRLECSFYHHLTGGKSDDMGEDLRTGDRNRADGPVDGSH